MSSGDPRLIDLRHLGRERVIGAWLVGDVLIDPGPQSCMHTLLAALGDERPRAIALTHIHLDHGGAAGSLVERWPDLEVWVHERGARHLVDPTKLLASAERIYAGDMHRLWGDFLAVPMKNLRMLVGGEEIEDFTVAYTPGHASHHVSYLHKPTGTAFVGDIGGVRTPPEGFVFAPTPPPDIDLELWRASLATLRAWAPQRLALTHFGAWEDVDAQLDRVEESLRHWGALARLLEEDEFVANVHETTLNATSPETAAAQEQAGPADHCWHGLRRYWSKREGLA